VDVVRLEWQQQHHQGVRGPEHHGLCFLFPVLARISAIPLVCSRCDDLPNPTRSNILRFPVHKIRHLFTVKAYVVPAAGIAFFIWAIVRAHGIGPIVKQPAALGGSALAWAIIKGIMSSIANFATLIVNE
jgi:hypothetical protein